MGKLLASVLDCGGMVVVCHTFDSVGKFSKSDTGRRLFGVVCVLAFWGFMYDLCVFDVGL